MKKTVMKQDLRRKVAKEQEQFPLWNTFPAV